ncbi:ribosomal protein S18 acetylase RimI-like enzyme [Natronocella acetinitrilica]|uniref:Ribosomal protein S18 acetylase RimI-like enzyme n=1 Tax=Natronocella acetinitrilica TaxID=414046 RepID=A0AAE3KD19_9GAMM|nr:peptidase C39 family protein [Natronocella acetinitrilica]MCP1676341.1 ribosomal protein S18 acetylase RimI-like enzyme [Natronocella acetinitrilica]
MIRPAALDDLSGLLELESRTFVTDRLSRRSFRHLLTRAHGVTLVAMDGARLLGYVVVLFRRGVSLARLYSIAVDPDARGRGIGQALVQAAEEAAIEEGCAEMRLEIRRDNPASIALFEGHGYRYFGAYSAYYEDAMDAVRYHRFLLPATAPDLVRVPYYRQTLDFTCGPATLMMAMHAHDAAMELDRMLELRLWRESTTIFMTSGHGGCGPHGLALAARHRGFPVRVYTPQAGPMFLDSVRSEEKRDVMRLVQEDFIRELGDGGVPIVPRAATVAELEREIGLGGIPLVLISSYRLYREKVPHWVVVSGVDERYVYIMDPFVEDDLGRSETDSINLPIGREEFERMSRYGRSAERAVVIVYPLESKARDGATADRR